MDEPTLTPRFGPTTSVVEAFLEQLRRVPEQPPHVTLPPAGPPRRASQLARTAVAEPPHRQAAVQAAQQAVAQVLGDLSWPLATDAVQHYVEQVAPEVAAVLVLRGYAAPDVLADDYEQVYVVGWRAVFGML